MNKRLDDITMHHSTSIDNKYKNIGCAVGLLLLLLPVALFFIMIKLMVLETSYREDEWIKYQLLTPDILKNAPRLTTDFVINIQARDGNAARVEVIKFHGTQDTLTLEHYLVSLGYYPVTEPFRAEIWYSPDNQFSAQVLRDSSDQSVSLAIFDEPAPLSVRKARD